MINVSSEFKELMQSRTDFRCNADITFADGDVLNLGSSAFTLSNNSITDAAGTSSFPLGVALSRVIQIELLNDNDQYIDYDFFGAKIRLYLTFALSATVEKIEMGTFTVLEPETYGETVIITARDDMYKADTPYSTKLTYPATLAAMFREICDNCDLSYSTSNFANSSFAVQTAPTGNLTHRQVLGYIAMIASGNVRINREGDIEILSYNLASLDSPQHSLKNWKNLKVDTSNIMITGLQTTVAAEDYDSEDVIYTFGDEGYMLAIENPLIVGQESEALELISAGFVGAAFRKFSGDYIAYPLIEFMDTVEITDRKGKTYTSVVTDINFVFFGITTLSNSAESALRNNSMYVSPTTKAIIAARKLVEKEKTARETAIEQLSQKLAQAGGFFSTDVTQPDGSTIRYMHDKPTLEASSNVIKITAEAIGFSTDGGETYPFGLEVSGDVVARLLSVEGINADWITSGALTVKDSAGNIVFSADTDTGTVVIAALSQTNQKIEDTKSELLGAIKGVEDSVDLTVVGKLDELGVGGRNLISKKELAWEDCEIDLESTNHITITNVGQGWTSVIYFNREYEPGTYTLNVVSNITGNNAVRVIANKNPGEWWSGNAYYDAIGYPFFTQITETPFTFAISETTKLAIVVNPGGSTEHVFTGLKLEKGDIATAWTLAPEDVADAQDVENEMASMRETITERYTSAVNTSESIILTALEKYVETSNYEEFKQTLEAQLKVMADEILMNFTTTTEQITNVDGDLQSKFTELYKYISFAGGTITLGSSDSAITLVIENDRIAFKRNGAEFGSWDGNYFYTGNIYVRVNESARFGNFAFLPRNDGSLMLQKVGG